MMERLETIIIYDLDRTLVDSDKKMDHDVSSVYNILQRPLTDEELKLVQRDWEHGAHLMGVSYAEFKQVFAEVRNNNTWKDSINNGIVTLYEGVIETLKGFEKDCIQGIVTRSTLKFTDEKIDGLGLRPFFPERYVQVTPLDKHTHPFKNRTAFYLFGVMSLYARSSGFNRLPGKIYFVGDRENDDIGSAKKLQEDMDNFQIEVMSVHVNHDGEELTKYIPDYTITDIRELSKIIRGNYNGRN